jgi:hypothetical protein
MGEEMSEPMKVGRTLAIANGLAAVGSMAASVVGLIDPATMLPAGSEVSAGVDFYAQAYAARALPLGAALLFALASRSNWGLRPLLVVAGLVQAGDSIIGVTQHNPGMAISAGTLAAIHLVSAWWLTRRGTGRDRAWSGLAHGSVVGADL